HPVCLYTLRCRTWFYLLKIFSSRLNDGTGTFTQYPIRCCRQIIHDYYRRKFFSRDSLGLGTVTCAHENALLYAGIAAAFQVTWPISNHITFRQVYPELIARVEKELRRGFPAAARSVGRFRSDVNLFEA